MREKVLDKSRSQFIRSLDATNFCNPIYSGAMKFKILKASAIFILLAAGLVPARGQIYHTNNFSFTVGTLIPDGDPNGLANNQVLGGMVDSIYSVTVGLNISGGFNGDLYAYLRLGDASSILLNRTGLGVANPNGYANTGFNVTFTPTATDNIHFYQDLTYTLNGSGQLTDIWQPDGRAIDPGSAPALFDSTSPTALLNLFAGANPNGTWTLFVSDLSNGAQSGLNDWKLQVITVPEPPAWALLVPGAFWLIWRLRQPRCRRNSAGAGRQRRRARVIDSVMSSRFRESPKRSFLQICVSSQSPRVPAVGLQHQRPAGKCIFLSYNHRGGC